MLLVFVIVFTSVACTPGAAQASAGATANAMASFGSGASATASSYAYSYYPPTTGVRDCTYNRCTPTCNIPSPQNCPENSNPCNCPPGTIISEQGGQCVQDQQCQRYINCKGDYNARHTDCPVRCPSTCAQPNGRFCGGQCAKPGCQCNPGFILSSINGRCIRPEQCPGGRVCGRNETFISCAVECPSNYCPVNESRVACGPSYPCPSGCSCSYGYLRKSVNDYSCILASDCPPGKCERPNEEWNKCVPLCFSDSCRDRLTGSTPGTCPFNPAECYPKCVCKKGYYRNEQYVCIPVEQCPSLN